MLRRVLGKFVPSFTVPHFKFYLAPRVVFLPLVYVNADRRPLAFVWPYVVALFLFFHFAKLVGRVFYRRHYGAVGQVRRGPVPLMGRRLFYYLVADFDDPFVLVKSSNGFFLRNGPGKNKCYIRSAS